MMSSHDSNRMYSWLWDSHISPRNSKWLQENLSDIDTTVKQMIKIIEEDGDSFAKRAEMYYKRRPELMRLVEQFYRAYRGLAERYSHATGVIRQAHHTMAEAFPDQVPPLLSTDECHNSTTKVGNVTVTEGCGWDEEMRIFEEKRSGLFEFGEKDTTLRSSGALELIKWEGNFKSGAKTGLEGEKEDGLVRFHMILEKLSVLELKLACAEEESIWLKTQAIAARNEVNFLKEALRRSEDEKEAAVFRYKRCVESITTLERELSCELGDGVEIQVETSKSGLVSAEKDTLLVQHSQCAKLISSLQKKLINAEDEVKRITERVDKAEEEVEWLKKEIEKLEEEKKVASLVYWQSIKKISSLENEFTSTQDEVLRLNEEISSTTFKLKGAEERYMLLERSKDYLQSEMKSLVHDMECRKHELLEKQTEFGRVRTRVQEEHSRYVEAETVLNKLHCMHSQCRDELKSVTLQFCSKEELLREHKIHIGSLEDEIVEMKETMEEQNLSSEFSTEYLKSENEELRANIMKLDKEIEVRVSQKNALQHEVQEICHELKSLQEKLANEKLTLEIEKAILVSLVEGVVYDADQLNKANARLKSSLINVNSEQYKLKEESSKLELKLRQTLDNNELLALEKSVLVMLFRQLRLEAEEFEKERNTLLENLNSESRKATALQNEVEGLLKMNEMLRKRLDERNNHVHDLNMKLSEFQESYRNSQIQNVKVLQENSSLRKDLLELKQKNRALEDENCMVLVEALSLSNISLVFKNFVTEKTIEVEELSKELEIVKTENDQLAQAVSNGKELLCEVESELHQAEQKLVETRKEKSLLEDNLEVLKGNFREVRESQEKHILRLSCENTREIANNTFLQKMVNQLDAELAVLRRQSGNSKARERTLSAELDDSRNQIKELFSQLLISSVEDTVFIEKASELTDKCRNLEKLRISENEDVLILQEKLSSLEGENVSLKAQVDTLSVAVDSLRDSILSLESQAGILKRAEELKEGGTRSNWNGEVSCDTNAASSGGVAMVNDLQSRIKALEKLIGDMGRKPEDMSTEIKHEVSREDDPRFKHGISDLKSQQSDVGIKKDVPEKSSLSDFDTPKDITLDQASKLKHYASSSKDQHMLELWEIGSEGQSIDLTVSKGQNQISNSSISEIVAVDEEVEVVDKVEISKRFIDSYHEENKRKMLEKLESEGLKLTNLQITVQDLITKVLITEKTKKKDHDIEYNTVKEQLEEAEEAITKLTETNAKLKNAVQDNDHINSKGKSQPEFEQAWNLKRRKILDHVNRGAERLTRLQLEVQKLQFLLLKLDNEQEKKPKTRITESGPKFLLKDYLQGRARSVRLSGTNQSKKKIFCGCIHPPTTDSPRYKKN